MSTLNFHEKQKLEKLFRMSGGYVLDFNDRTFGEFFDDFTNVDIHSDKYQINGSSKARKLRAFWEVEPDHLVGIVVLELIRVAQKTAAPKNQDLMEELGLGNIDQPAAAEYAHLIEECKEIANRLLADEPYLDHLTEIASQSGHEYIRQQMDRMENALESDDLELAIGTAKEMIETCCKTILEKRGVPLEGNLEMSDLTKAVFKELKLTNDDISPNMEGADSIRRIQSNIASLSNEIARLRNLYGTGHGKTADSLGLSKRHAKLMVSSAAVLVVFLFDSQDEQLLIQERPPRKPLGQWLVDNVPRGTNLEPPSRHELGRPNAFLEEEGR